MVYLPCTTLLVGNSGEFSKVRFLTYLYSGSLRDSGGVRFALPSLTWEFSDTVSSRTRTSTQNTVKFLDRPLRSRVTLMSCHMTRYTFAQTYIVTVADQYAERHLLSGWHYAPLDKRSKSPVFRTGNHGLESRRVYMGYDVSLDNVPIQPCLVKDIGRDNM